MEVNVCVCKYVRMYAYSELRHLFCDFKWFYCYVTCCHHSVLSVKKAK